MREFKLNFILVFLTLGISCTCNIDNQHKKKEEALSFLNFYQKNILKKDSIILLKNSFDSDYKDCVTRFRNDEKYKDFNEKDFLRNEGFIWDKNAIPNAKLISTLDLPDFRTPEGWKNFRKKHGDGYYVMSYPVTSNNLKYIAFYTAYYCGERCGFGQYSLYEKTETGWKLLKKYCDWVS